MKKITKFKKTNLTNKDEILLSAQIEGNKIHLRLKCRDREAAEVVVLTGIPVIDWKIENKCMEEFGLTQSEVLRLCADYIKKKEKFKHLADKITSGVIMSTELYRFKIK